MEEKRKIKAKPLVKDIRSGKSHNQLMEKYSLSANELHLVINRLVAAGFLDNGTVDGSSVDTPDRVPSERRSQRCYLTAFLPVYDVDDLLAEGQLHDISRTGIRVSGIETHSGDEKNLVIEVSHAVDVYPLCVTAVCRWTQTEPDGCIVAGFEVMTWPPMADQVLEKIARFLALCDEEERTDL